MEAGDSSDKITLIYQVARRHYPEHSVIKPYVIFQSERVDENKIKSLEKI
jgi:hypothetical protein